MVVIGRPTFASLGHMLSFSSGVMLFISFIDLMPEAVASVGFAQANLAFFAGMFLFALVVHFVPEPDVASFVKPKRGKQSEANLTKSERQNLLYAGMCATLGISLHNFPE